MTQIKAEIPANVWQVHFQHGDVVEAGQELLLLESMKMEIPVFAPVKGVVALHVTVGESVHEGQLLAEVTHEG